MLSIFESNINQYECFTEKIVGNVNRTIDLLPDGGYMQYEYHLGDM